jgi:hypothetical protein
MEFLSRLMHLRRNIHSSRTAPALADDLALDASTTKALIADLDIDAAIVAHENWVRRFRAVIQGTSREHLTPIQVARAENSAIGKWLQSVGKRQLGHSPTFHILIDRHRNFHREAALVLAHSQAGQSQAAKKRWETSFRHASNQVVLLLRMQRQHLKPVHK